MKAGAARARFCDNFKKSMKIILLRDVAKVGRKNEIKEVADGYARNFLLANDLAKPATDLAIKEWENNQETIKKQAEEDLKKEETVIAALDGQEFEIKAKADENGKLYGSITAVKIAKMLKEHNFEVAKEQIKLVESLKEIGEYDVLVEMSHGLEAKIKIVILSEEKEGEIQQ